MEEHLLYKKEDGGLILLCPIMIKYATKYNTKYSLDEEDLLRVSYLINEEDLNI